VTTGTKTGFRDEPTLAELDRRLFEQWDLGLDRDAAVETARQMAARLKTRSLRINVLADFWYVSHAAEVLWDSDHADEACELAAFWRMSINKFCADAGVDPAAPRVWAAILCARAAHRARDFGGAIEWVQWAIAEVRRLHGEERLAENLELGISCEATELYCAALAIAIPAGRMRFGKVPTLRAQILDAWVADAQLMLSGVDAPKLRRVHALVIQTFFALTEREWSEETEDWLLRLVRLDDLTRPQNDRGLKTKPLRDEAFARFCSETEKAARLREMAISFLAGLPRHLRALKLNGWWQHKPLN